MYPEKHNQLKESVPSCQQPRTKKTELHLTRALRKKHCWHLQTRYCSNFSDPVSTESQSTKHK